MESTSKETADSIIELLKVLRKLRAPDGCPWDQKQTSILSK